MSSRLSSPFRRGTRYASEGRGRVFMVGLGVLGLGIVVLMVAIAYNAPNAIPGRGYYTVQAAFDDADNLTPHSQVRLGGRLVGQVIKPRVDSDGKAVVDLQMDPEYGPLRSDSTVEVRPRSAVGVRYVDIVPGQNGRPLKDGERLPSSRTSATTALDEVLGTFDAKTRTGTQQVLRGLGGGLAGRGADLNEALGAGPDMLRGTESVLGEIAGREGAMRGLIRGGASAAGAADPVRRELGASFAPAAKAMRPFSDRADAVRDTLEEAPSALRAANDQLPAVDQLAQELSGFAGELGPALRPAPVAFSQTSELLDEARPRLRDASRTLRLADRAVDPTLNLLDTVKAVAPTLDTTFAQSTPLVTTLGRYGCDVVALGARWGSMLAYGNEAGGALRFLVVSPTAEGAFGAGEFGKDNAAGDFLYANKADGYPAPCVRTSKGRD